MHRFFLLVLLVLVSASAVQADRAPATAEERGDAAWDRRAEGFPGALDPQPIEDTIAAYREALAAEPGNLEVLLKLMEAIYFRGISSPPTTSSAGSSTSAWSR